MVRVIDRLPTEEEEMGKVTRAEHLIKGYYKGFPFVEIYRPKKGTWISVQDYKLDYFLLVFPLENLIKTKGDDSVLEARGLAEFFEKKDEGEYTVLMR